MIRSIRLLATARMQRRRQHALMKLLIATDRRTPTRCRLWLVTWHLGLFIVLTFGQIGFKGRTEDYFEK